MRVERLAGPNHSGSLMAIRVSYVVWEGKLRLKGGKSLPRIPLLRGITTGIFTEIFQAKTRALPLL